MKKGSTCLGFRILGLGFRGLKGFRNWRVQSLGALLLRSLGVQWLGVLGFRGFNL